MTSWEHLRPYFPTEWMAALETLTYEETAGVRELYLRRGEPIVASTARGQRYLCTDGLTGLRQTGVVYCRPGQLERCVSLLCEESVYAYQEQLQQGFLSLPGGIRVGVAGRAIHRGTGVAGVQDITSLCVRLPGRYRGCAAGVLPHIIDGDGLQSILLVGEPSSGKTTLLRDIAAGLAARSVRVTVVDERGELAGPDGLPGCDVLVGYPKAVGLLQAVRCLSPQVVVFDELGGIEEVEAVTACAHAGVAVVASLHGSQPEGVARRPVACTLIEGRVFDRWLFLAGRDTPGRVRTSLCPEVIGHEVHWTAADRGGWGRVGAVRFPSLVPAGGHATAAGAGDGGTAAAAHLFCPPYGSVVAAVGEHG